MFVEDNHGSWDKHLHELRYAMNTATQASTRQSPCLLILGVTQHLLPVYVERVKIESFITITEEQWLDRLKKLDALRELALKFLNEDSQQQRDRYNKGRLHLEFFVGD